MFTIALITGLGVGSSTILGSLIAFSFKSISHKANDSILGFAAGVMLSATVFSLIIPSMETPGANIFITCLGILAGTLFVHSLERFVPHVHSIIGTENNSDYLNKMILFVMAIAIHNFPEGMAVGVSFAGGNIANALSIAIGISLQNIPEGIITVFPLISAGVARKKAALIGIFTGFTEVIGVLVGFASTTISESILSFLLAFAGGTMLYVISHEMIPETHSHGHENEATFSLVFGFLAMMLIDSFL